MTIMKFKYLMIIPITALIYSCTSWLDIDPKDSVAEKELFEVGDGYRIALNGVYKWASAKELYGQELTWGLLSVMGCDYNLGRNGIAIGEPYYTIGYQFNYNDYDLARPTLDRIWIQGYSCIANCNNLIGNIRDENPSKFRQGEAEKSLILGEALAVRALLHFDILRLYAPAKDDGQAYIPYYGQDGVSTGEVRRTVNEVLERVVTDLTEAQELTVVMDTLATELRGMMASDGAARFTQSYQHADQVPAELRESFFTCRAYRMNYFAVTALLARVYNYMGNHEKAYAEARRVLDYRIDEALGSPFEFIEGGSVDDNMKTYPDIIFCLADTKLYENYEPYTVATNNPRYLSIQSSLFSNFDDQADYRKTKLIRDLQNYTYRSLKFPKPAIESANSVINADILPIIRLSEMWYIKAEYEASIGEYDAAEASLDMVRMGRGCTGGNLEITDQASFQTELLKEVRREFVAEGQTYLYHKKLGVIPPGSRMKPENFVFPKPDVEDIQL